MKRTTSLRHLAPNNRADPTVIAETSTLMLRSVCLDPFLKHLNVVYPGVHHVAEPQSDASPQELKERPGLRASVCSISCLHFNMMLVGPTQRLIYSFIYFCFCVLVGSADGALRIDISVHERDLENMAKGKRWRPAWRAGAVYHRQQLFLFLIAVWLVFPANKHSFMQQLPVIISYPIY